MSSYKWHVTIKGDEKTKCGRKASGKGRVLLLKRSESKFMSLPWEYRCLACERKLGLF